MDRRRFLKTLAQSSAALGASLFIERVWGMPIANLIRRRHPKIYTWGEGTSYFNFRATAAPTPQVILADLAWAKVSPSAAAVAASGFIFAQKLNGNILCWGKNNQGQLGLGNTITLSSPVLFGSNTLWNQISCGGDHSVGIQVGGTLWGWGASGLGQLGLGNTTSQTSPMQVGALNNWTQVFAGVAATYALQGQSLFVMGSNANGKLGTGNASHLSSPVQVSGAWAHLACTQTHILGIKSDRTLWAWGYNNVYQLGQANTTPRSSPTQVGAQSDWDKVFTGDGLSYAIKTNGTLWAWGKNAQGQLGVGYLAGSISTPTQVGSDTNWSRVASGADHTLALKTDGSLWAWGYANISGAIGNNQISGQFMTPIAISGGWSDIAANDQWSLAVKK